MTKQRMTIGSARARAIQSLLVLCAWSAGWGDFVAARAADLVLNEFNAVSSGQYLKSARVDTQFGRVQGNGQNWLEFMVVADNPSRVVDLRGWKLEWQYDKLDMDQNKGSGSFTFSQDPLWAAVPQGTILTLTDWQEAWYLKNTPAFPENPNGDPSAAGGVQREGGVNGLGRQRNNPFVAADHTFRDMSTDLAYNPELNDWHINVFAGERDPRTGGFLYFSFDGNVTVNGENFAVGAADNAGLFSVNNDNWQFRIRTAQGAVAQGPIGEALLSSGGWGVGAVGGDEIGKLEIGFDVTDGPTIADYAAAAGRAYSDGSSSTFGLPNMGTGYNQGVSSLRSWFDPASIVNRATISPGSNFTNAAQWQGGAVPTAVQEAAFDQNSLSPDEIVFTADAQTRRLIVRRDKVTLKLSGKKYQLSSSESFLPGLVVGESADQNGLLNVDGGTVAAVHALIGQRTGANGEIVVGGVGSRLEVAQSLTVGGAGDRKGGVGLLNVFVNGRAVIGNTLKAFSGSSIRAVGGTITVGPGAVENNPGTIRVWKEGVLDIRGGTIESNAIELAGTLAGYGALAVELNSSGGNFFVPEYDDGLPGTLAAERIVRLSGKSTKRGGGALVQVDSSIWANNASLEVLEGTLKFDLNGPDTVGVGPNSSVQIRTGARLEMAGTKSGLSHSLPNVPPAVFYVGVLNDSADGVRVTGKNQEMGALAGAGQTTVAAGSDLSVAGLIQGGLKLEGANGRVTIRPEGGPAGLAALKTLSIADGATLDLNDNDLILEYADASPLSSIQQQILNGLGNVAESARIASTHATTLVGQGEFPITLHVAFDNAGPNAGAGEWLGRPLVGTKQIIAKYTFFGDLNLDGQVDASDYLVVDNSFGQITSGGPFAGDANLDGMVDAGDYIFIDNAFGRGAASPLGEVSAVAPVPEPAAIGLAICGAALLAACRWIRIRGGWNGPGPGISPMNRTT